jgi:hypothetical protein
VDGWTPLLELGESSRGVNWEKCRDGRGESTRIAADGTVGLGAKSSHCGIIKQYFARNRVTTTDGENSKKKTHHFYGGNTIKITGIG